MMTIAVVFLAGSAIAQHNEIPVAPGSDPVKELLRVLPSTLDPKPGSKAMPRLIPKKPAFGEPKIDLAEVPEEELDGFEEKARSYIRRQFKPATSSKSKLNTVRFEKVGHQYLVSWEYDDYSVTLADGRPGYRWIWSVWVTPRDLSPPAVATLSNPASKPKDEPASALPEKRPLPDPPKQVSSNPPVGEPPGKPRPTAKPVQPATTPSPSAEPEASSAQPKPLPDQPPAAIQQAAEPKPSTEPSTPTDDYAHLEPVLLFKPLPTGRQLYTGGGGDLAEFSRGQLAEQRRLIEDRQAREQEGAQQIIAGGAEAALFVATVEFPVAGLVVGGARSFYDTYQKTESFGQALGAVGVNTAVGVAGGKLTEKIGAWTVGKGLQLGLSGTGQALVGKNLDAAGNFIGDQISGAINDQMTGRNGRKVVETYNPPPPKPELYRTGGITLELQQ